MTQMKMKIGKTLLTEQEITKRVQEMADEINQEFPEGELIVVGVLKGCFVFISDLVRRLKSDVNVYFMEVSSYGQGTVSSGGLVIKKDLDVDIRGKNVLVAEDIIDTGNTMVKMTEMLRERGPSKLKVCTLLSKPERRTVEFEADYTGFVIPDRFIIGYGLDCAERFRQLPYIAEVDLM